ncbi:MAG: DUF4870 domain-containing protein [Candidatus Brocadiia bacterium]
MKNWEEEHRLRSARKYAQLAVIVPLWGLLFTLMVYRYIARLSPYDRRMVSQAIAWQIIMNMIHALFWSFILGVSFIYEGRWAFAGTLMGLIALVIWILLFFVGIFMGLIAANSVEKNEEFRYPIISGLRRYRQPR